MKTAPLPSDSASSVRRVRAWLRDQDTVRRLRLACGWVMFSYLTFHFSNHALGNISLGAMTWDLQFHEWIWHAPIGGTALYCLDLRRTGPLLDLPRPGASRLRKPAAAAPARGIDLAIRNGALSDSSLVARKIGESAVVAVASAEYLERRGEPTRPGDLDRHDGVIFVSQDGPRPWTFASRAGVISYQAAASFRSNDGEQLRAAVLAGLGITQAPYWLFAADIRAGTVRRILRDREPARIPISAVRPASRRQPSKVAVFVDFLAELLAETDD